jgi:hypothetical protein
MSVDRSSAVGFGVFGGSAGAKDTVNSIFEPVLGGNSLFSIIFARPANFAGRSAIIEGCPAMVGGRPATVAERPSIVGERP